MKTARAETRYDIKPPLTAQAALLIRPQTKRYTPKKEDTRWPRRVSPQPYVVIIAVLDGGAKHHRPAEFILP
jgi:hypothetical protein